MTNHHHSRRGFLSLTGAGIAGVVSGPWLDAAAAAEGDADLVVFNANVYTVDSRTPKAEAFAVNAGRFSAVGNNVGIKALIGKGTQTFDARQMTIVPGFIDCHNHAPGNYFWYPAGALGPVYQRQYRRNSSVDDGNRRKSRLRRWWPGVSLP